MSTALMPAAPEQEIVIARPPEIVLEEARRAAVALKEVIDAKPNPVKFNNETYLEFEDWQTVGRFYGISPRITATRYVEFGEAKGFEATAEAVQVATDKIVSRAEAMCLNDEAKWSARPKYEWHYVKKSGGTSAEDPGREEIIWEKPAGSQKSRPRKERVMVGNEAVPLFQLRSMAQTRACAKAMRNALAWVVVLAGFKPTPAEELDGVIDAHRKLRGERDMGAAQIVDDVDVTQDIPGVGLNSAAPQASSSPASAASAELAGAAEPISADQAASLRSAFADCDKLAEEAFLKIAKIEKVENLAASDFDEAIDWVKRRKAKFTKA